MTFYSDIAADALELLREFGQAVTLARNMPGTYDAATSAPASGSMLTYTGTGAVFDYSQRDVDGTKIRTGDRRVLLATSGMVMPRTGDTITIGSTALTVVTGREINPAGVPVLYEAQVRGVTA